MALEQTPKVTPPQKSYTKQLVGIAVLIVLMFVMVAVITIHLAGKKP